MTEQVTLEERYSVAISAKRLDPNLVGPTRTLAQMALAGDSLGSILLRLQAEYDSARASEHLKTATDAALMLCKLPTLRAAQTALTAFALRKARRHGTRSRYADEAHVPGIAAHVLMVWVDPRCPVCTGRGQHGGNGKKIEVCRACGGSGRRKSKPLHNTPNGAAFGASLLAEVERKVSRTLTQASVK